MKCQTVVDRLADLSSEHLSTPAATELLAHLEQCPACRREWSVFQQTMLVLSTTSQPLLASHDSRRLWQGCRDSVMPPAGVATRPTPLPERRDEPGFRHWATAQPSWGWLALGGAVAVLGGVWVFGPAPQPEQPMPPRVTFQNPPSTASPLVDNHAALAFDPFTDHVGSTLVSYSATREGR